jgi:hypothetical protein
MKISEILREGQTSPTHQTPVPRQAAKNEGGKLVVEIKESDWKGGHTGQYINKLKVHLKNQKMRLRYGDRPFDSIMIEELPTKPVKKQLRRASLSLYNLDHLPDSDVFMTVNLVKHWVPITASMNFDQALQALHQSYQKAADIWSEKHADILDKSINNRYFMNIEVEQVWYLQVEPFDVDPITVKGKDFGGKATWTSFSFYSPDSDFQQMDPHYTEYESSSPAAARQFYKVLKANPAALKETPWASFSDWLRKAKIAYKTNHSVWH